MDALRDDVRSFVEMIRGDPPPWIALEMPFGMGEEPATIDAAGGPVPVRGYIDRLDDTGAELHVVDYKTGRDYGYGGKSGVYDGGRRLQHLVYTLAAGTVTGRPVARMEYHFPTRRGENRVRAFDAAELASGGGLVAALLEGVAAGRFPATDDAGEDCRFCDFAEVCGVRTDRWGRNPSCRHAEWTARNLGRLPELDLLKRVRNWEDEEPVF